MIRCLNQQRGKNGLCCSEFGKQLGRNCCQCMGIQMTTYLRPLVLMIDDDPEFLEIAEVKVSQMGYRTIVAHGGAEGLQRFQSHGPDLVILDLSMPDMSGLEVLWWIRLASDCPVIFLTVTDDIEPFLKAMELEVNDYLTKGVGLEELVGRVELILGTAGWPVRGGGGDQ